MMRPARTLDQIIRNENEYTSDKGRDLARKYRVNLEKMVSEIRRHYSHTELEFVYRPEPKTTEGIYFASQEGNPYSEQYLAIEMYSTTEYNTLQTDYSQRAASVFLRYGLSLFDIVYRDKDIMAADDVYGIGITLQWMAKNFLSEKYFGGKREGIAVVTTKSVCGDFIEGKITNQEFLRKSKVIGVQGDVPLGLIEIDLGKGL
ncbi:MAG: hypothetical protein Q8M92_05600 [Candidatus Subteraquimicrobiales bacterium]|nr:hypothetical protein [Candidatus Subteraquimicrobiales bacterium]